MMVDPATECLPRPASAAYVIADVRLDPERTALIGSRGEIVLPDRLYRVIERLMRRPRVLVPGTELIAAMFDDPDDEPDDADATLRAHIKRLRGAVCLLSSKGVYIRTERMIGYAVDVSR